MQSIISIKVSTLQVCKQQQTASGNKNFVKYVCVSNLLIVCPLTMKLCTLIYYDKSSSKQILQVCKQQQTASGNNIMFVPITCILWVL